jgi:hypothetical protein
VSARKAAAPAETTVELRRALERGFGTELEATAALLNAGDGDAALARALVRKLADEQLGRVHVPQLEPPAASEERADAGRGPGERASFVARWTQQDERAGATIERLQDLRVLLGLVRAGSLPQRRAAVLRVGALLASNTAQPSEHVRAAEHLLAELRAFSIAYELWHVRSKLAGAEGRQARVEGERWNELNAAYLRDVNAFWEGERDEEPTAALADVARAQLLARTRDLPDAALRHLGAVIQGCDGVSSRDARASLLRALRHAGDARLLPALRATLDGEELDLAAPAARALASIVDPRVHPLLRVAYERTTTPELRVVLALGLAIHGDRRSLGYVREVVAGGDEQLMPRALEALAELGGRDDVQNLTVLLGHRDVRVVSSAVRALGRIADGRALIPLAELRTKPTNSALLGELEEAEQAIRSRMELLGEEAPAVALAAHSFDTAKHTALVRGKDPALVRVRALWSYLLGQLWLGLGATTRGIARLETAAALRPEWVAPVLALAVDAARRSELAQALPAFRRALGIDRSAVERSTTAARLMAETFLRRADAMARDGREEIARGLLEEALAFDLRKAPGPLRFALEQRQQAIEAKQLGAGAA